MVQMQSQVSSKTKYYIYIIFCENNTLYTGVTTDYKRRFIEHTSKKVGAKFTKAFKPEKIVALWKTDGRSSAQKLEARIRKLKKDDKLSLIENNRLFKKYFDLDSKLYKRLKLK